MPSVADKITIVYPSGAHGNFLKMLLNVMLGQTVLAWNGMTYDGVQATTPSLFDINHHWQCAAAPVVNIQVKDQSLLKYCAVCMNRTAGVNLILEHLHIDTFEKINSHPIFKHFVASLIEIAPLQTHRHVPVGYLREWARLCFFANNCHTIKQWMQTSVHADPEITVDFECFYNGQVQQECLKILDHFGLQPVTQDIDELVKQFEKNNRYRLIDYQAQRIIASIAADNSIDIVSSNFLLESWIDHWLHVNFDIDPLLKDSYFTTTQSLICQYNLHDRRS